MARIIAVTLKLRACELLHAFALWLVLSFAARAAVAQIHVGRNVLVSGARPGLVHNEVLLAADPTDPDRLIGCSLAIAPDHVTVPTLRRVGRESVVGMKPSYGLAYVTRDAGESWALAAELSPTDTTRGGDNHCIFGADGAALFVTAIWRAPPQAGAPGAPDYRPTLLTRRSADGGMTWSTWTPAPGSPGVDRMYAVADDTHGKYHGRVYVSAHIRVYSVDGELMGTGLTLWRSLDGGITWQSPVVRTQAAAYGIFNPWNPVVLSDGTVVLLFNEVPGANPHGPPVSGRPMPLKVALSRDGGETLAESYLVAEVPDRSSVPAVLAVDRSDGPFRDRLYAVWGDRASGRIEIKLAYSADRGRTWSRPVTVSDARARADTTKGPDATLPTVAVNARGVVGVLWYDRRDQPENRGYTVRFAASLDGGETWLPSVRVAQRPMTLFGGERLTTGAGVELLNRAGVGARSRLEVAHDEWEEGGHTAGLAPDGHGRFHALWVDNRTGLHQVYTALITVDGEAQRHGGGALARLADASAQGVLNLTTSAFDERTRTMTLSARVWNISSTDTLRAPVHVRVLDLASDYGVPRIANADNHLAGMGAVWDFTSLVKSRALAPGARSDARVLIIHLDSVRTLADPHYYRHKLLRLDAQVLAAPRAVSAGSASAARAP